MTERTKPWDRRRDKSGGFARTRRWEKSLERQGLEDRSIAVASIPIKDRLSDGKGSFTLWVDRIRRMRPDWMGKMISRKRRNQTPPEMD